MRCMGWDGVALGAWISAECRACKLALNHAANEHWPFAFLAEQTFTLNEDGLTIITKFTNSDPNHAPYGLGQHPYIMRPQGTRLFAQVNGVWLTDDTALPTKHINLPAKWDWRKGCALNDVFVDNCFEPLQGAVRVVWPDSSELTIEGSDNLRFLIIYNPPLENYVCVELVTHMPDAINRAEKDKAIPASQSCLQGTPLSRSIALDTDLRRDLHSHSGFRVINPQNFPAMGGGILLVHFQMVAPALAA